MKPWSQGNTVHNFMMKWNHFSCLLHLVLECMLKLQVQRRTLCYQSFTLQKVDSLSPLTILENITFASIVILQDGVFSLEENFEFTWRFWLVNMPMITKKLLLKINLQNFN